MFTFAMLTLLPHAQMCREGIRKISILNWSFFCPLEMLEEYLNISTFFSELISKSGEFGVTCRKKKNVKQNKKATAVHVTVHLQINAAAKAKPFCEANSRTGLTPRSINCSHSCAKSTTRWPAPTIASSPRN